MTSFVPTQNRILVRRADKVTKTEGGIILPDAVQDAPAHGTVLAVGPGTRLSTGELIPVGIDVADTILFSKFAGAELTVDGENLWLITEKDVLGVYEC